MSFGAKQFELSEVQYLQNCLCDKQSWALHTISSEKSQFINLANKSFGFNGWSYSIVKQELDYIDFDDTYKVGVCCSVKVTLKDGTFREDRGYGTAEAVHKGQAIEKARKVASSEALKETLKGFGVIFQNFGVGSNRCSYPSNFLGNSQQNQHHRLASGQHSNSSSSDIEECNGSIECLSLPTTSSKRRQKSVDSSCKKSRNSTVVAGKSENHLNNSDVVEEALTLRSSTPLLVEANTSEQTAIAVGESSVGEKGNPNYSTRLRSRKQHQNQLSHEKNASEVGVVSSKTEISPLTLPAHLKGKVSQNSGVAVNPVPPLKIQSDNNPSQLPGIKKLDFLTSLISRSRSRELYLY